jgi:hypothetical protein
MLADPESSSNEVEEIDDSETLSFFGEIKSVWLGAIALLFPGNAKIYLQDEIILASWRRFWMAFVSIILIGGILPSLGSRLFFHYLELPVPSVTFPHRIFDYTWFGIVLFFALIVVFFIGVYLSRRVSNQNVETKSGFLEHINALAAVFLSRLIVAGPISLIGGICTTIVLFHSLGGYPYKLPVSIDIVTLNAVGCGVLNFIIICYSYWLISRIFKVLYDDLRVRSLWISAGVLFFAIDVFYIWLNYLLTNLFIIRVLDRPIKIFGF